MTRGSSWRGRTQVRVRGAALGIACLCVGCGPRAGSGEGDAGAETGADDDDDTGTTISASSASATGAATTDATNADSTTASDGCGDGVPESGVFCFQRIDVADVGGPVRLATTDFDGDGVWDLGVSAEAGKCRSYSGRGYCPLRWLDADLEVVQASADLYTGCGLLWLGVVKDEQRLMTCGDELIRTHEFVDGAIQSLGDEPLPEGPFYTPRPFLDLDIDEDGVDELLVQDLIDPEGLWETPLVLRRDGDGWLQSGEPLPLRTSNVQRYPSAKGDLDGDGIPEITLEDSAYVAADPPRHVHYDPMIHQLVVLRADAGTLVEHARFAAGTWPTSLHMRDLDLDGHLDLVVRGTDRLGLARGVGDGSFADVELVDIDGFAPNDDLWILGVQLADLDGDGDAELLVAITSEGVSSSGDLVVIDDPLASAIPTIMATAIAKGDPTIDSRIVAQDITGDSFADIAISSTVDGDDRLSLFVAIP